jgi:hypothetical protein
VGLWRRRQASPRPTIVAKHATRRQSCGLDNVLIKLGELKTQNLLSRILRVKQRRRLGVRLQSAWASAVITVRAAARECLLLFGGWGRDAWCFHHLGLFMSCRSLLSCVFSFRILFSGIVIDDMLSVKLSLLTYSCIHRHLHSGFHFRRHISGLSHMPALSLVALLSVSRAREW